MAEGRISPNEFLSGLGDQAKNHDPGHKSAGKNPYKQITMLIIDLLFFPDNHIPVHLSEG